MIIEPPSFFLRHASQTRRHDGFRPGRAKSRQRVFDRLAVYSKLRNAYLGGVRNRCETLFDGAGRKWHRIAQFLCCNRHGELDDRRAPLRLMHIGNALSIFVQHKWKERWHRTLQTVHIFK